MINKFVHKYGKSITILLKLLTVLIISISILLLLNCSIATTLEFKNDKVSEPSWNISINNQEEQDKQLKISRKDLLCWLLGCRGTSTVGKPARRRKAGRRGKCNNLKLPLIALVPEVSKEGIKDTKKKSGIELKSSNSSEEDKKFLGLTLNKHPRFWIYIPDLSSKNISGESIEFTEFMIQDESNNDILDTPIQASLNKQQGGVIFQSLPESITLKPNQPYHWFFSIICDHRRPSRNISVDGWVQIIQINDGDPVDSGFKQQLEAIEDPKKLVSFYADNGIWHEAVTLSAKLRCSYPDNIELLQMWKQLMNDAGLNQISNAPILRCPSI